MNAAALSGFKAQSTILKYVGSHFAPACYPNQHQRQLHLTKSFNNTSITTYLNHLHTNERIKLMFEVLGKVPVVEKMHGNLVLQA